MPLPYPSPRLRYSLPPLAWALLALAAAWSLLWLAHSLGYWEDDAWIHLEFARSLARGHGFQFNGITVYGDTAPLWVFLLDAVHLLVPNWLLAGKVLTVLGAVFALFGLFAFARSVVVGNADPLPAREADLFAAAAVLLTVLNPFFGYWAFSGMEALSALGLVCWACALVGPLALTPRRFLLAALCAGLAPLLRPEMAFFTVLLGLILLQRWITMPRHPQERLGLLAAGFLLAAAPALAWGAYALHAFGSLLPTTNAAKRADPRDSVLLRLFDVYGLGFPLILLGGLVFLTWIFSWWQAGKQRRTLTSAPLTPPGSYLHAGAWLLFFWTVLNAIFYVVNHTFVQTRYIFVTAPALTIALLALAAKLHPRLYRTALAAGCLLGATVSLLATWPLIRNKVQLDRDYADLAAFLRTLPRNAPVAHYSIGEAAFLSEHSLVDTGGITRPGVIPFLWDTSPDRRLAWVHHERARFWIIDHQPEPGATLVWQRSIPSTGWYLDPRRYATHDLLEVWRLPAAPTFPVGGELPTAGTP